MTSGKQEEEDSDMVSRRKILSRSRDDLNLDYAYLEDEEDVWYQKEKLFRGHFLHGTVCMGRVPHVSVARSEKFPSRSVRKRN
ncbi:unnamed protein product [Darwinula stevensoni]|uniref:Uncharacterized protein n=1 Tax=Darwinula stevensoni TaxID=69355 RepID=A0A7R9FP11_9CRUS|nr:unnamed protein product [Darwinula stevensoni]CAG0897429.1 unnamed protein product [Darwinula stevensoni]